ncbi:MAG: phosphoribosylanthranilate isomerase [Bacteroidetes bacterium]|nr:MAG: phosphoribosylanthranilate isomerase [Bacteroidota bacterium]
MRVKVCGMTQLEQVRKLDEMGLDFAGFIFYPKSPRYAAKFLRGEVLKKAKLRIGKVGVFVNSSYDEVMKTVDEYGLDMVQLHGDETPRLCEQLANYISVIKVFRLGDNDPIDWITRPYFESCDMFLFDTLGVGYGGTGKKFNWEVLKSASLDKLFFLSGGIEPGDVKKLKEFSSDPVASKLFSIDINSRFETSGGIKDLDKVQTFFQEIR